MQISTIMSGNALHMYKGRGREIAIPPPEGGGTEIFLILSRTWSVGKPVSLWWYLPYLQQGNRRMGVRTLSSGLEDSKVAHFRDIDLK